ncbi:MAG: PEGA domain-containing protein [Nitrospira sp.]|nr:PEGA domain-containing protein [Nitrospira sp.]
MWNSTGVVLTLYAVLSGCGSIIHGSRQAVSFNTTPAGATVQLQNGTRFATPYTADLRRAEDYTVTIEKDGYEAERITIKRDFNAIATILGNILWIDPGVIVDVMVGGAWTLDPEHINVQLVAQKTKSE